MSYTLFVAEGDVAGAFKRGEAEKIRIYLNFLGFEFSEEALSPEAIATKCESGELLTGQMPALLLPGEASTVEMSGNIMKFLGSQDEHSRSRNCERKVDAIAEFASAKHQEIAAGGEFGPVFDQIERILRHGLEEDQPFKAIAPSEFTYGDATLFELINAVKEAKGGLKTRAWTTAKEFHDSTAQFDAIATHIGGR